MALQNFLYFWELCSLDGSCIKVVGTPISLANNFWVDGKSPINFIGTTKTNALSDTKSGIQVLPCEDLARFVTNKVSVKKCELICRYISIILFVEKLPEILPFVYCCFN